MKLQKIRSLAQEIIHEIDNSEGKPFENFRIDVTDSQIICTWDALSTGEMDIEYYAEGINSVWQHSVRKYGHDLKVEDERFHISIGREAVWHVKAVAGSHDEEKTDSNIPEEDEEEIEYTDFTDKKQNVSGNLRYTGDYLYNPFITDAPITLINSTNSLKLDVNGKSNTGIVMGGLGNEDTILENFDIRNVLQKDRNTVDTSAAIRIERGGNYTIRDGKISNIDSESYTDKPVTRGIHIINSGSEKRDVLIDNVDFENIVCSTVSGRHSRMDADAIVIRDDKGASPTGNRITTIKGCRFKDVQKRFIKGNDPDTLYIDHNEFHVTMPMAQSCTAQEPSKGRYVGNKTIVDFPVSRGEMMAIGGNTRAAQEHKWGKWFITNNEIKSNVDGGCAIWIVIYSDLEIDLKDNVFEGNFDAIIQADIKGGSLTINASNNEFTGDFIKSNKPDSVIIN